MQLHSLFIRNRLKETVVASCRKLRKRTRSDERTIHSLETCQFWLLVAKYFFNQKMYY